MEYSIGEQQRESIREIIQAETRRVSDKLALSEILPTAEGSTRTKIAQTIAQTGLETASILGIKRFDFMLLFDALRESMKKRGITGQDACCQVHRDASLFSASIIFDVALLQETAEKLETDEEADSALDYLIEVTAHEAYHAREYYLFPNRFARAGAKWGVLAERSEEAADLFALNYLRARRAQGNFH